MQIFFDFLYQCVIFTLYCMKIFTKKLFFTFILSMFTALAANAQYISRSETPNFTCPVVCAGGTITLKVFQIQNLPAGSQIQVFLSSPTGSFAAGTSTLPVSQFSTNQGTTWQNGPYTYTSNINDLFIRAIIPVAATPSSNYTLKIRASTGYVSNDLFQCNGGNNFTITAPVAVLPPVNQNDYGINQWIGHVYNWIPTTSNLLNTPALISAQSFFSSTNYQGHVLVNSLSFDNNFSNTGGVPGIQNDGTSIACGNDLTTNFAIRYKRRHNFAPGLYTINIACDDGARLSIDGGATWLLDSFIEQNYASSAKTTATNNPQGICLSGSVDLVYEYFQRPAQARVTINFTQNTSLFAQPLNQTICAGQNTTFSVGANNAALTYQWQVSTNGGTSWTNLNNTPPYSGTNTSNLVITAATANLNSNQYQCVVSGGSCGISITSNPATLLVSPSANIITQPVSTAFCNDPTLTFSLTANGSNGIIYQWQINTGSGFVNLTNNATYSGTTSSNLIINNPTAGMVGHQFQCIVTACGANVTSTIVSILPGAQVNITSQPQSTSICVSNSTTFIVAISGSGNFQWQMNSGGGFQNLTNNATFSGVTTNQLTISNATLGLNGNEFQCVISGTCSVDIISQIAFLTVGNGPTAVTQPSDQSICASTPIQFNGLGANATSYQWMYSNDGGVTYLPFSDVPGVISGAQGSNLNLLNPSINENGYLIYCALSNDCGSDNTNTALLTVLSTPEITQQPADITICQGETGNINIQPQITGQSYTWLWQNGSSNFTAIPSNVGFTGANSANLVANGTILQPGIYPIQVSVNSCGLSVVSSVATLTILAKPSITQQPENVLICSNQNATFQIAVTNFNSLQWQIDYGSGFENLVDNQNINGVNTTTLSFLNPDNNIVGKPIRFIALGDCPDEVVSNSVIIELIEAPTIILSPSDANTCSGKPISFSIVYSGFAQEIQWQVSTNGSNFTNLNESGLYTGTQSPILTLPNTESEMNGSIFRCVISGCGTQSFSNPAKLSVTANDPFYIPNSFSPNGDDINAEFKVYTEGNVILNAFIYNRWGETVFAWSDKNKGWDGTFNGNPAPDGLYVYKISVRTACEQKTEYGSINVIRD